jgi:hypothetical protein
MGGPWIKPETEQLVLATWLIMNKKGQKPTAKEVMKYVDAQLKAENKHHLRTPGIRKTQNILMLARKELEKRSEEQKELDTPWTVGSAIRHGINPEAMPAVLRVWRLNMAAGIQLTVREARWVAQLYALFSNIHELREFASQYASAEQIYELSKQLSKSKEAFGTHDTDCFFFMDNWEYATAQKLGLLGPSATPFKFSTPRSIQIRKGDGKKAADFATIMATSRRMFERDLPSEIIPLEDWRKFKKEHTEPELSEQAAWIFAYLLTYLSKGPKWPQLSMFEMMEVMFKLQNWVLTLKPPESIESLAKSLDAESFRKMQQGEITDYQKKLIKAEEPPAELLKLVGYN